MPLNDIFPTSLGARQLITFLDPANPTNKFSPNLNPQIIKRKPGNLRKYVETTNSTSILTGSFEGPPAELSISFSMLDTTQIDGIVPFTQISPVVFIDNNDNAFYGVLVVDNDEQLNNYTRNIWALDLSFLVISPYDGLHTTLPKLTAPTITATLSGSAGYIPTGQDIYLWATVFTSRAADSESVVGAVTHIHTSSSNVSYNLSWTPPSSLYFSKLRVYWNTVNNPVTSTMLTEVYSGFPQDSPNSFSLFNNYVAYNSEAPPTFSLSYNGYWAGARWVPVT